jgi:hypothetical protein
MAGFEGVPMARWEEEAKKHYVETPEGLKINYDPKLRDAFLAAERAGDARSLAGLRRLRRPAAGD